MYGGREGPLSSAKASVFISSLPHVEVPGEGHERHRGGPDAEARGAGALQGLQGARPLHATLRGLHHRSRGGHRGRGLEELAHTKGSRSIGNLGLDAVCRPYSPASSSLASLKVYLIYAHTPKMADLSTTVGMQIIGDVYSCHKRIGRQSDSCKINGHFQ